jgi:FkbM family methyltransferase
MKQTVLALCEKFIGALPRIWSTELFRITARCIGVKYACFPGRPGIFEAPIYDRVGWIHYVKGDLNCGTCDLLKQLFVCGSGTLIDVGANIGLICIPVKRDVPGINVFAVEPDADNCVCLRNNAFRAGISDIVLFDRAAYRQDTLKEFERANDNSGDHRIRGQGSSTVADLYHESSRSVTQIRASTLDSMIPRSMLKGPVVLKCDVQGAETDVLAGATELIDSVDVMVIEFWPYGLKRMGSNIEELLSYVGRFSYGARFDVMDKGSIQMLPIHELSEQLRRIYASETGVAHSDVILSKQKIFEPSEPRDKQPAL